MKSRHTPAIFLTTTDLSCEWGVKDLTCRRYAADEMITGDSFEVELGISRALSACRSSFLIRLIFKAMAGARSISAIE